MMTFTRFHPMRLALMIAVAIIVFASLHGCAQVEGFFSSPTAAPVITASVDIAIGTAESKGITAAQINKVAKAALAADSGVSGTLSAVTALVTSAVTAAKLPAADQAAADILMTALSAAVQAKVGTNATLATTQANVATVLNAVIAATGG